ncbi:hypothetical protein PR048_026674 [Dryococelus australis]|uniref:Uncharacterized protein n=1 Tax=Dryococelus australis TaxID=614101 RepID=A0ABQ9GM15_9NEOP|nr:hypothetical protein PR048_026674 [Dryococelus australis]
MYGTQYVPMEFPPPNLFSTSDPIVIALVFTLSEIILLNRQNARFKARFELILVRRSEHNGATFICTVPGSSRCLTLVHCSTSIVQPGIVKLFHWVKELEIFIANIFYESKRMSPPTWENRVRFPAGSYPVFRMWESCWTMPMAGESRFPRPYVPALFHTHLAPPLSALKTSMFLAVPTTSFVYFLTGWPPDGWNYEQVARNERRGMSFRKMVKYLLGEAKNAELQRHNACDINKQPANKQVKRRIANERGIRDSTCDNPPILFVKAERHGRLGRRVHSFLPCIIIQKNASALW